MSRPDQNCPDCAGTGETVDLSGETRRCYCTRDTEPHDPDR